MRPIVGEAALGLLARTKRGDEEERLDTQRTDPFIGAPCRSLTKHFYDLLHDDTRDLERFPENLHPSGGDTSEFYHFAALNEFCKSWHFG